MLTCNPSSGSVGHRTIQIEASPELQQIPGPFGSVRTNCLKKNLLGIGISPAEGIAWQDLWS